MKHLTISILFLLVMSGSYVNAEPHRVYCGSVSEVISLNGPRFLGCPLLDSCEDKVRQYMVDRIGWTATDDLFQAEDNLDGGVFISSAYTPTTLDAGDTITEACVVIGFDPSIIDAIKRIRALEAAMQDGYFGSQRRRADEIKMDLRNEVNAKFLELARESLNAEER